MTDFSFAEKCISGIGLGAAIAISPGPVLTLAVSEGMRNGAKAGAVVALGTTLATLPVLLLALVVQFELSASVEIKQALAVGGSLFLAYCAYDAWKSKPQQASEMTGLVEPFLKSVMCTLLSPFPYAFWLTVGIPLAKANTSHTTVALALFGSGYSISMFLTNAIIGAIFALWSNRIQKHHMRLLFRVSAVMLMIFSLKLLVRQSYAGTPAEKNNNCEEIMSSPQGATMNTVEITSHALAEMGFSQDILRFLSNQKSVTKQIDTWAIIPSNIVEAHPNRDAALKTRFLNSGEGYLFSLLIKDALSRDTSQRISTILDLGCGSSLPSLSALLEFTDRSGIRLLGIDIDANAISVSRHNSIILGLNHRSEFIEADMNTYLSAHEYDVDTLIVANPPYVPAPNNLADDFFVPVDAGVDGLRYLRGILEVPRVHGTLMAVVASTLSSPASLISMIQRDYNIIGVHSYLTRFGKYLNDPRLLSYIQGLDREGQISIGRSPEGAYYFVTVGFILQKK